MGELSARSPGGADREPPPRWTPRSGTRGTSWPGLPGVTRGGALCPGARVRRHGAGPDRNPRRRGRAGARPQPLRPHAAADGGHAEAARRAGVRCPGCGIALLHLHLDDGARDGSGGGVEKAHRHPRPAEPDRRRHRGQPHPGRPHLLRGALPAPQPARDDRRRDCGTAQPALPDRRRPRGRGLPQLEAGAVARRNRPPLHPPRPRTCRPSIPPPSIPAPA